MYISKSSKKICTLAGVFVVAVGVYFILVQNAIEKQDMVYTVTGDPTLPMVYTSMFGSYDDRMPGYLEDMEQKTVRDCLTAPPQGRQLKLKTVNYGESVLSTRHETRSMDLEHLVEKTEVQRWGDQEGAVYVTLPIQNLLTKGAQYLFHLTPQTGRHETIHYYTWIVEEGNAYGEEMVNSARDFSVKIPDSQEVQTFVTYLKTNDAEGNISLGTVAIKPGLSQLTWVGLKTQLADEMRVILKELDGIMGETQVRYNLNRELEDGVMETYSVTDYYTVKYNTQRPYLMDFKRNTIRVFDGGREFYFGYRILLGVGNDDAVKAKSSIDRCYLAYTFNEGLWSYDQTDGKAVKAFSFQTREDVSGCSAYDQHDIQTVSARDSGDIDFLVYGYMNRGHHEGYVGVSLYRYDQPTGAIVEKFFAPAKNNYESLKQDMEQLCYLNNADMPYMLIDHTVYGIGLTSNEHTAATNALEEGSYSVSGDRHSLVWQEGQRLYEARALHPLNLEIGQRQEVTGENDSYLRVLGSVNGDFVYRLSHPEDLWVVNGRVEILPMYAMGIVDKNLQMETRHEEPGYYLADVDVEDARVYMSRLIRSGDGFAYQDDDTIVRNIAAEEDKMAGIGWFASEIRRKPYSIQLDVDIETGKSIKISAPKKITYDTLEALMLRSNQQMQGMMFYAYGQGRLVGSSRDFSEAVAMAYDKMGYVIGNKQRIAWDRVNHSPSKAIRERQSAAYNITKHLGEFTVSDDFGDGYLILDTRGCTLNQMLYLIGQGTPVVAFAENDHYILLYGFDQHNISVYDPAADQTCKMGLNDVGEYFTRYKNGFICAISID